MLRRVAERKAHRGVISGNLFATFTLLLILTIAAAAVVGTIVLPLRRTVTGLPRDLVGAGTAYFCLIGCGFMLAEIGLLQTFSVFLGHPIYSLGVGLFGLILATGAGSLASDRWTIGDRRAARRWSTALGAFLVLLPLVLPALLQATTSQPLPVRAVVALAVIGPAGFGMGFAFPTGMRWVERIDATPTPWFWGMNGAAGVLASVLAVVLGIAFGIHVTLMTAGACYLLLQPAFRVLDRLGGSAP